MKTVLLKTTQIESCWETTDACFVRMKSGRVWICSLYKANKRNLERTYNFIKSSKQDQIIEVALAKKEGK